MIHLASDAETIKELADALKPFAEWALPTGVVAAIGEEWFAAWQHRAQKALKAAGHLDPALVALRDREESGG